MKEHRRSLSERWLLGLLMLRTVVGDLFTSRHDMEALAHHETRLFSAVREHLQIQRSKLTLLKRMYNKLSKERLTEPKVPKNIQNPLSAFSLIKRLVREWPLALNLITESHEFPDDLLEFPSEEDLGSAIRGLARLQNAYSINIQDLAEGRVTEQPGHTNMTASDCLEMGRFWYHHAAFQLACSWFEYALEKYIKSDMTIEVQGVLSNLYVSTVFAGCVPDKQISPTNGYRSRELLYNLLKNYPAFVPNERLVNDFRQALAGNCSWAQELSRAKEFPFTDPETEQFNELCRGLGDPPTGLRCYYIHYNNPRLLLAPFKMEELYIDPPVLMFHEIISEVEVNDMMAAFHDVKRECQTLTDKKPTLSQFRLCHYGWVLDKQTPTSARLTRRVGDMTGLYMETSEINQVANYGLAGEFMPHYDSFYKDDLPKGLPNGNRIATLMFYLNDVTAGGYTVFPYLNLTIIPQRGSAVLWFNTDGHGEMHSSMLHGGCPVLSGTKWVINKWIHEEGQDAEITCPADEQFPKKYYYLNK